MIRYGIRVENAVREIPEFDVKLNNAINSLEIKMPQEWQTVLDYLRSMAYLEQVDAANIELVCAEYNKKQHMLRVIRRLKGLDQI